MNFTEAEYFERLKKEKSKVLFRISLFVGALVFLQSALRFRDGAVVSAYAGLLIVAAAFVSCYYAQRGKVAEARQLMVNVRVAREELERTATRASQLDQQAQSDETGLTFLGNAVAPQTASFADNFIRLFCRLDPTGLRRQSRSVCRTMPSGFPGGLFF